MANLSIPEGLDPQAVNLARAIRKQEGGDYHNYSGDGGTSAGAYQWSNYDAKGNRAKMVPGQVPTFFQEQAKQYGLDSADFSPKNQDMVAYHAIKDLKDNKKYNVIQIASVWNGGDPNRYDPKYVTPGGVPSQRAGSFDVPAYAKAVNDYYQQLKQQTGDISSAPSDITQETHPELGSFGAGPVDLSEGKVPLGEKALGLGKTFLGAIADPLTQFGGSVLEGVTGVSQNQMMGTPESHSLQGITGNRIDKFGYRNEQKLTPGQTAEQVGGNLLQNATIAIAPELKGAGTLAKLGIAGGIGGLQGAGTAMNEGGSVGDVALSTAIGVPLGVATAGAPILGSKLLGKIIPPGVDTVNKNIINEFTKAVKPTVVGKNTAGAVEKYNQDALDALHAINANKGNLIYSDGVSGARNPQSLQELAEAIPQTKQQVYKLYNDITKEATGQGAVVDVNGISKELDSVINDKALNISNPNAVEYAKSLRDRLASVGNLDAETAEKVIQNYNTSLQAYYKNQTYESASKAGIDALVANKFRQQLDSAIENATGAKYQELKTLYGSLKAIEKDVNKRNIVNGRKQPIGLIDYADIFSAGDLLHGLATINPGIFAKGIAQRSIKEYLKHLNNPDTAIKSIFKQIEKKGYKATKIAGELAQPSKTFTPEPEKTEVPPLPQNLREILLKQAKDNTSQDTSLEKYIPDSELPTIEMGKGMKSKYLQDTGLPTIDTAPNVYSDKTGNEIKLTKLILNGKESGINATLPWGQEEKTIGAYKNKIAELEKAGITHISVSNQNKNTKDILDKLLKDEVLTNPSLMDGNGNPTRFEIFKKGIYESYIPKENMPSIDAGKTPKPKHMRHIPGLPEIRY